MRMFNILFVASWVSAAARALVNEIRQTDFLFLETSYAFGGCPLPPSRKPLPAVCELPVGIGVILANGARPLSISR